MEFGDWIGMNFTMNKSMDDTTMFGYSDGDRALFMENLSRVRRMDLRQMYDMYGADGLNWVFVKRLAEGIQQYKKEHGLMDYTDMLEEFIRADWAPPVEVVIVDEAQDLSRLQWDVVWLIARTASRVIIAGDDDQAIYRWAGADVEYFIHLKGRSRVLGQSWRVPSTIQKVSADIISRVGDRREKDWAPKEGSDGVVDFSGGIEGVDLSGSSVLILGRNVFSLRNIATQLRRDGYLFDFRGQSSIKPSVLRAVRTWESLRRGEEVPADDVRAVYEQMSSGRGIKRGYKKLPGLSPDHPCTLQFLQESGGLLVTSPWFDSLDRIDGEEVKYLRRAVSNGERPGVNRIRVSTIHGAKGGEADHVVLSPDMALRTFKEAQKNPEDEARVWYVGVTRARQTLTILKPKDKHHYVI
jgi:DNA helicase-2/ATP-dependent DNA helicase PcrA